MALGVEESKEIVEDVFWESIRLGESPSKRYRLYSSVIGKNSCLANFNTKRTKPC